MVKITVVCDNRDKRILKCQEGNRICFQGTSYSESLKFPGTKWGVRLR